MNYEAERQWFTDSLCGLTSELERIESEPIPLRRIGARIHRSRVRQRIRLGEQALESLNALETIDEAAADQLSARERRAAGSLRQGIPRLP
jgi:hypothetical protein